MKEDQQEQHQASNRHTVKSILDNFRRNIFGIEYYFNKFGNLAQGADEDGLKQTSQYIIDSFKELGVDLDFSKEKTKDINIPLDKVADFFRKIKKQPKISAQNYEILSRSSFLMLNNYFEYLISDLLSYYYSKFQNSLNEKKFNIALKEINEFDSLEDFTKSLITKEVESMIVELSFNDLLDHFHNTLGINNEKDIVKWDTIIECRERRHLIVHNSSLVNKKYISRTKNPFNLKIGDTVHVDSEYFLNSCKEFFLAGLLLSYNSWGKWDKEEITQAIKEIMIDSFELLKQHEFELVARFTDYLQKIEPRSDEQEDFLMRARVNRMIALKKLGNESTLTKELKDLKVGTASPIFKLAYSILAGKHENIVELIRQSKAVDELDIHRYREWPIYEFVRSIPEINSKIETELGTTGANMVLPKAKLDNMQSTDGIIKPL